MKISSTVDNKRRHIIKLIPFALANSVIGPRPSFACGESLPPDIHLLDDFPGTVGSLEWTSFAYTVVPTRKTKKNPQGVPALQIDDEWVKRVAISIPKNVDIHSNYRINASFDDSNLPEGYWCSGLIIILESELRVIDNRDRNFFVKAHQLAIHARFTRSAVPYISTGVKLTPKRSHIGIIACVEEPDGGIINVPRGIEVPKPYGPSCSFEIYATSSDEMERLRRAYSR